MPHPSSFSDDDDEGSELGPDDDDDELNDDDDELNGDGEEYDDEDEEEDDGGGSDDGGAPLRQQRSVFEAVGHESERLLEQLEREDATLAASKARAGERSSAEEQYCVARRARRQRQLYEVRGGL